MRELYAEVDPRFRGGSPYGSGSGRLRDYSFSLEANVPQILPAGDTTSLTIVSASAGAPVEVTFDAGSSKSRLMPGEGLDDNYLGDVYLKSAAAQTVVVRISRGYQRSAQTVNVNSTATVSVSNTCDAVADISIPATSSAALVGANADRKELLITNLSNTVTIRVGSAGTVGASAGTPIFPLQTAVITTEAAVSAYNPGGAAVSVAVTELARP